MKQTLKKVIVFGCGSNSGRVRKWLEKDETILAFSDNDPAKQGTRHLGLPVLKPSELLQYPFDRILIASHYSDAICDQLLNLGIPCKQIQILNREALVLGAPPSHNLLRKAKAWTLLSWLKLLRKRN